MTVILSVTGVLTAVDLQDLAGSPNS